MGRRSTQSEPQAPPSESDLRWGAEIFAQRAGFMPYGPRIAMYVYAKDAELLERLLRTFGGRVTRVSSTNRWMIYAELLSSFLSGISPFLKDEDSVRKAALAEEVLDVERTRVRSIPDDSTLLTASALAGDASRARRSTDSPTHLPEVDESEVEVRGTVPPGPWTVEDPILRMAADSPEGLHLLALTASNAEAFAEIARTAGLLADCVRAGGKIVVRLSQDPSVKRPAKVLQHKAKEKA